MSYPVEALLDVAFPPVGRLGLTSPRSPVLCDATTTIWPSRGPSLCRSFPDPLRASLSLCSPRRARSLVEAPSKRQGLWSPGPPVRDVRQGARGLSQVPELPLCSHAPLSDPGGALGTRHSAPRTAAFQSLHTVGFATTYIFRGSITRPVCSLHPASYGPLQGGTRVRY